MAAGGGRTVEIDAGAGRMLAGMNSARNEPDDDASPEHTTPDDTFPEGASPEDSTADDTDDTVPQGARSPADQSPTEDAPNTADFELSEEDIAAAEVHQVTPQRIRDWLKSNGHNYLIRPSGQPAGMWNGSLFTFTATTHVLQIRGQWNRTISIERRTEFMNLINNFHARNPWPKCLLQVMDDGSMRFTCEIDTPIAHGLSDQQLTRAMRLGIGSAISLYNRLDKEFPDPLMASGAA